MAAASCSDWVRTGCIESRICGAGHRLRTGCAGIDPHLTDVDRHRRPRQIDEPAVELPLVDHHPHDEGHQMHHHRVGCSGQFRSRQGLAIEVDIDPVFERLVRRDRCGRPSFLGRGCHRSSKSRPRPLSTTAESWMRRSAGRTHAVRRRRRHGFFTEGHAANCLAGRHDDPSAA